VTTASQRWAHTSRTLPLFALALSLSGCGTRGFAPDAVVENPGAEAFLTQVGRACGNLNLGPADINALLQSQDDVYFVDETTKLWFGEVSKAQYADDLSGFYPGGSTPRAITCIVAQLPAAPAQR
jgi:hypothetical protein